MASLNISDCTPAYTPPTERWRDLSPSMKRTIKNQVSEGKDNPYAICMKIFGVMAGIGLIALLSTHGEMTLTASTVIGVSTLGCAIAAIVLRQLGKRYLSQPEEQRRAQLEYEREKYLRGDGNTAGVDRETLKALIQGSFEEFYAHINRVSGGLGPLVAAGYITETDGNAVRALLDQWTNVQYSGAVRGLSKTAPSDGVNKQWAQLQEGFKKTYPAAANS